MSGIEETAFALSRKKILPVIFSSIFFITPLGVWMFTLDADFILSFSRYNSPIFVHTFGAVVAAFGSIGGLYLILRFRDGRGLVLNSTGIDDYITRVGFISWHEIAGTQVVKTEWMLAIKLKFPDKFLARQSWYKRVLLKLTIGFYGTPAVLKLNLLNARPEEVRDCINQYLKKYGRA